MADGKYPALAAVEGPRAVAADGLYAQLFEKASSSLDANTLELMADVAGSQACEIAENMAVLCEGLGGMVAEDRTGYLQGRSELPHVLWLLGQLSRQVQGLGQLAQDARFEAYQRSMATSSVSGGGSHVTA